MIPPHLAKRPVWRGLPVPYVNCWGTEADEHGWVARVDPHVGQLAWYAVGEEGQGDAFLARQCPQRQREVVVLGRCQVCRRELRRDRRFLLVSTSTTDIVKNVVGRDGLEHLAVSEPWLCERCLNYTLGTCPGIRNRERANDLVVIRCTQAELLLAQAWHDDHGRDVPAISYVKIAPHDGEAWTVDEWRAAA